MPISLAWFYNGPGEDLYKELTQKVLGLNIVGWFLMPMPTQPLGWFKFEPKTAKDSQNLKYRTVGLASNVMQAMGLKVTQLPGGEIIPAMEKGVIEAVDTTIRRPIAGSELPTSPRSRC